jgi:predicted permease
MILLRWWYRMLARLLPRAIRERHSAELQELFDYLIAAPASRTARLRTAFSAILDLTLRIPYEHTRRWQRHERGVFMSRSFGFELKQAVRSAWRQPGTATLVILMLALGVAANTMVFTLINALYLRPLPWEESERLVYLDERAPKWNLEYTGINYPDFDTWRKDVRAFEGIALYDSWTFNVADGQNVERIDGAVITHDYLNVMKLRPVLGRGFTPEEDKPGGERVALISQELWQTRYAGARDVLGRALTINSETFTIVGVLPKAAAFPNRVQIWLPLRGDPAQPWQSYSYSGVGRLKPSVTVAAAEQDLIRAHQPIFAQRDSVRTVTPRAEPLRERLVGEFRPLSIALAAGVAIVLLIACANVSSVMLARSTSRQREIGIRRALGAGSFPLARQLILENAFLAGVGAVLGVVWGYWAVRTLLARLPDDVPPWLYFDPDVRVLAFAAGLALLTALLSALGPVIQALRSNVQFTLASQTSNRTSASRGQRRTLSMLVAGEIALACVLLVGGGLLLRAYNSLQQVDPGFRVDHALSFRVALPAVKYPQRANSRAFYERLIERLQTIPGVQHVGAITCPPLSCHMGNFVEIEGEPPRTPEQGNPVTLVRLATSAYDEAIGLQLARGRFLDRSDDLADSTAARSMVVNETFVNTFLRERDPIGKRVRFGDGNWWTIVGVTRDIKHYGLSEPMRPGLYLPVSQLDGGASLALIVRTRVQPTSIVSNVRAAVRELDPELPLFQIRTMEEALAESLSTRRMYSWLLALFAGVALTLAVGGIYGVLSYVVGQRRREIGIRVALGAQRNSVLRLVISQGLLLAGVGLTLGVAGALAVTRLMGSLLFDIDAQDPATFAIVIGVLGLTALIAAYIPARRALRYEPQSVLRE